VFARKKDNWAIQIYCSMRLLMVLTPICQRFRRLSPDKKLEMYQLLHDMLQKEFHFIIEEPVGCPNSSKKRNSCFCVDYRQKLIQ